MALLYLIPTFVFGYYILYKFLMESDGSYFLYLLFLGLFLIGCGFVMNFSKRGFYIIESAGILFLMVVLSTVVLHDDVIEKIKDYFK